ncbi:MAG: response regulator [Alphaproteobacteria bacterium]|nr:response regulator [Alphaproteobacteria bacterium]
MRVSVDLLENLMTMVSELVLTRNQLMQLIRNQHDSAFAVPLQRLSQVTTELQEGVMKTRMQPIGNAWAKLPRIVRDLGNELHKKIELVMIGAETELDRQVLELIKDPLTHMVRNSGDHGLEVPGERRAAGKPEIGKIVLKAYHEGGHIVILISDDGKGLPLDKIKQKILQNNLATPQQLAGMTEQQIYQYIFKAGFSTATKVTSVSGRGVGMDVVRTNIEKIGGTVELSSTPGKGSVFTIKIPLTLAIVSALIVESGGERFAIPQIGVVELVRASKDGEQRIERIKKTPVLRLRNRLLPLISLREALGLDAPGEAKAVADEAFIVVSQVGNQKFGIIVDRVFDTEEIVVKPVAPLLRDIEMFSGNTILGDGSVIMILDLNGVAAAMGESAIRERDAKEEGEGGRREWSDGDRVALLVFRAGSKEPKAVPLALVARLEDIEVEKIEHTDGQKLVQYRGQLMPLISMDPGQRAQEAGRQAVVVFTDRDHSMGLIVDEIVDIVESPLKVEIASQRSGMLGSAVIAGKATEVIDAAFLLTQANAAWFAGSDKPFGEMEKPKRVLIVDDSPFFRNMLEPVLRVAGYDVVAAEGADIALKMRDAGQEFDAIISDIEMPNINGFQFVETVRKGGAWKEMPMVALSSYHTPKDMERGREAGFDDYIAKFDREGLLGALRQVIDTRAGGAS